MATLDDIGFAPEPVTAGRQRRILLHHCPFREAAEEHREVVCTIHLGLMRGLLAELDAPIDATGSTRSWNRPVRDPPVEQAVAGGSRGHA